MKNYPTIPLYELLTQNNTTLLAVSDGGADKSKVMAHSVGYLALTRKSYGNAKTSHEVIQCHPAELKGIVASPTFAFYTLPSMPGNSNF
jgi:hypothetical protein